MCLAQAGLHPEEAAFYSNPNKNTPTPQTVHRGKQQGCPHLGGGVPFSNLHKGAA